MDFETNLDMASRILASAEVLGCHAVIDGRTASNPYYLRDQKRMMVRMMGEELAKKLEPLSERFVKEKDGNEALYGPASVELSGEIVVMTRSALNALTGCIRTEQKRAAMPVLTVQP